MSPDSALTLHTGRKMPILGLGTWELTNDTADTVAAALSLGYRLIDTSGDYGTQTGIGEALRRSGLNREDVYLVTKVEENEDAYKATRRNLDQLQQDYADLMLIHRPPATGPGRALWQGLIKAKQDGLAKDIGVSNYPIILIEELADETGELPTVNQIEWSPFGFSTTMLEYCRDRGIIIQAYSPLTRTARLDDDTLNAIADRYDKTPAQLLIRWNLQLGTAPLPKANQRAHLEENIQVFDFEINEQHMAALDDLNERYSALGVLPYE